MGVGGVEPSFVCVRSIPRRVGFGEGVCVCVCVGGGGGVESSIVFVCCIPPWHLRY